MYILEDTEQKHIKLYTLDNTSRPCSQNYGLSEQEKEPPQASTSDRVGKSRPRSAGMLLKSSSEYIGNNHNAFFLPKTFNKRENKREGQTIKQNGSSRVMNGSYWLLYFSHILWQKLNNEDYISYTPEMALKSHSTVYLLSNTHQCKTEKAQDRISTEKHLLKIHLPAQVILPPDSSSLLINLKYCLR